MLKAEVERINIYHDEDTIATLEVQDQNVLSVNMKNVYMDFEDILAFKDELIKSYVLMFPEHFDEGGMYENFKLEKGDS